MGRIRQLGDQDRAGLGEEAGEEAKDGPRGNEGLDVFREALHDAERNASYDTNEDGLLAPETIGDPSDEEESEELSSGVDGVHGTEDGALRVVEVGLPLRQGL